MLHGFDTLTDVALPTPSGKWSLMVDGFGFPTPNLYND